MSVMAGGAEGSKTPLPLKEVRGESLPTVPHSQISAKEAPGRPADHAGFQSCSHSHSQVPSTWNQPGGQSSIWGEPLPKQHV